MERTEILMAVQSVGQAIAEKAVDVPTEAWSYASDPRILLGAGFAAALGAMVIATGVLGQADGQNSNEIKDK